MEGSSLAPAAGSEARQVNLIRWSGPVLTVLVAAAAVSLELTGRELPGMAVALLLCVVLSAFLGGVWPGLASCFIAFGLETVALGMQGGLSSMSMETQLRLSILALSNLSSALLVGVLRQRSLHQREESQLTRQLVEELEQKDAVQQEMARLSRAYAVLQKCNFALIHGTSEVVLLGEMCANLVHQAGYGLSFVYYFDAEIPETLKLVASAGAVRAALPEQIDIAAGGNAAGRSVLTARTVISRNLEEDPDFAPWAAELARLGLSSAICLPIKAGDVVHGTLCIFSTNRSAFNAEEIRLLTELADDLGFGINDRRRIVQLEQLTEQLAETSAHIRSVYTAIRSPIAILGPDLNVKVANPAYCEVHGLEPLACNGYACRNREAFGGGPCTRHDSDCPSRMARITGQEQVATFSRASGPGVQQVIEITATPVVDAAGGIVEIVEVVRDISQQRSLERQVQQTQKLEAIGTLAGGIAHDFNNILFGIIGFTELAMDSVPPDSDTADNLREVLTASGRASELVRQILTFSRRTETRQMEIRLSDVAREVLKLIRASLPTTIEIRTEFRTIGLVEADPAQLHQVLMNLCTNAGHAMPQGGVLQVSVTEATVEDQMELGGSTLEAGSYVVLSVSDTGVGMDEEVKRRLFEPFFTTKGVGEGTGLGLPVVHGIVTAHGGAVSVYSEPGAGSTFRVYLPGSARTLPAPVEADPVVASGSERVLYVDDEPSLARMGERILARRGYTVTAMSSALDALARLKADPAAFDAVITDQTMPHMTGTELAIRIREVSPGLPVILCTGFTLSLPEDQLEAGGIRAVLPKPIVPQELEATLRRVLDGGRP
jgi:signal transduction histidine kinase/putative methionine-R-sulfoxide reductase with GAF domain